MKRQSTSAFLLASDRAASPWSAALGPALPVATAVFAVVIFILDAFVYFDIAIAVLYVAVVLMSVSFLGRRGVQIVSAICFALTILAFLIQHPGIGIADSSARCIISLLAISITTFLALRIQSTTAALRSQAKLLDLTHDAIFVRDMNGAIVYWNSGAEKLYGWSAKEIVGANSHQLVQTVFPAPYGEITAQLVRTGYWEGDLVHTKRDGGKVTVSSRWSLQRNERGEPAAVLETNTDIEERKRAQEKLAKAQAELAHVSRVSTLGELAASIAHEVNQPLAAIVTSGEACLRWLSRDVPQLDNVKRGVERMIVDGRRASEVVRHLRALSKKADSSKALVNLNEVIEDAIFLIQREVSSHGVWLELDLARMLPKVSGDRIQLQQVVINLLMNAIQAMESIVGRPRKLVVRSREDSSQVLVVVEDSGPGFDPESETQLFNAFFTTKPDGMGMGLSICRSIIEAHGGRIWAAPNAGGGAIFQFSLLLDIESPT